MKKYLISFTFLLFPLFLNAQYEQQWSIGLSAGGFKTIGPTGTDDRPMQMPNYKPGLAFSGGIQYKISNRLSVFAEGGLMLSQRWIYKGDEYICDLTWTINDPITEELLAQGENYLDIYNYSFGIKAKYYFIPEKKWNPYFHAGANINRTLCFFENTEWAAYKNLGWLDVNDTIPPNDNLENSTGFGFSTGLGIEYSPNDKFHFYLESAYHMIILDKTKFKDVLREENFHAIRLQLGLRWNFIKSKEL